MHKTAFIGHRIIHNKHLFEKLIRAIQNQIDYGCRFFTMGSHGDYDNLALLACRNAKKQYPDLQIEVVITSLNAISNKDSNGNMYSDVSTIMFDIENAYYKQKITLSNRKMIDSSDTLICYVDEKSYMSGAKTTLLYAKKKGLNIINLYDEEDEMLYKESNEKLEEMLKNNKKIYN